MTNIKDFLVRNRKLFSVFFSVVFSVFVVSVIVHGATTIGTYIATGGDINASGTLLVDGAGTSTFRGNLEVENAVGFGSFASSTQALVNNSVDFGAFDGAFKDMYASGTIYATTTNVSNSKTAGYQINGGTVLNTLFTANLILGEEAGYNLIEGSTSNTFIGYQAGYSATNTNATWTVGNNIALGSYALYSLTDGFSNVAIGNDALALNTSGYDNVAVGAYSMDSNISGIVNTALGHATLNNNITGRNNVSVGAFASYWDASATNTTAIGYRAGVGVDGTSNENNVFLGYQSGEGIETGSYNTFLGYQTGDSVTTGASNVLIGYDVDAPTPTTSNHLNLADLYYGDLSSGFAGIGTAFPSDVLTVVGGDLAIGNGSATSTFGSNGTSTLAGTMTINKSGATSTLQIGSGDAVANEGGCIVLGAAGSTAAPLYIYVLESTGGGELMLATSTNASDCY